MPQFTQWNVPDPFPNILYNPAAVDKAVNENVQGQQTIGMNDMSVVARAAAPLLGMSEEDAAKAYPGIVADLQRQGFGKQAPPTYPGHAVTTSLVQRGMTVPEQYQSGLLTAPGVAEALKAAGQPLSFGNSGVVTGGGGGGAGGPRASDAVGGNQIANAKAIHAGLVARGMDNETALAMSANLLGESGGNWQTNPGDGGASHGIAQWNKERLAAFQAANGGKLPAQTNLDAQLDFLTKEWKADHNGAATAAGQFANAEGKIAPIVSKYEVSANQPADIARRSAYLNQLRAAGIGTSGGTAMAAAPINPNAGPLPVPPVPPTVVPPPSQAAAAVPPSPTAARLNGTDVAGPGAGTDMVPIPNPHPFYQTGLPGVTIGLPTNGMAPPQQTAAAPPPPVTQAPAAPIQAQPATQPRTGQNSPQFQAAMELNRRAQMLDMVVDPTGRTKQMAASLRAQAALYMQADSVTYDPRTGIGTKAITGEQVNAPKPNVDLPPGYKLDANGHAVYTSGLPQDPQIGKQAEQQFNQENKLRDEFQKLTGDFRIVQTSFENIRSAAKANDGAGDMSMLYNYVRLLDPTSVVRESEFAAAAASGSFGQRVQGAVERVLSGARMPESLRESFIREGKNLYNNQLRSHNTVADQYETLAKANGLDPARVVTRFARPQEDPADGGPVTVKTPSEAEALKPGTPYQTPDGRKFVR